MTGLVRSAKLQGLAGIGRFAKRLPCAGRLGSGFRFAQSLGLRCGGGVGDGGGRCLWGCQHETVADSFNLRSEK